MKNNTKATNNKHFSLGIGLLAAFAIWTTLLCLIDVKPIGPQNSSVGFAALNEWFHHLTGVHMFLYTLTDWLGLVPIAFASGFAILGLVQWIRRKSLFRVDSDILILGGFYVVIIAIFLFFESFIINYRPVLINGILEASYPSSTTLLTLSIMPTTLIQFNIRIKQSPLKRWLFLAIVLFTAFMVLARLISGVHWFSDIVGGILLCSGLVALYQALM